MHVNCISFLRITKLSIDMLMNVMFHECTNIRSYELEGEGYRYTTLRGTGMLFILTACWYLIFFAISAAKHSCYH